MPHHRVGKLPSRHRGDGFGQDSSVRHALPSLYYCNTLARYLVPIISRIHHQRQSSCAAAPRARSDEVKLPAAVIIAPTHELVEQIAKAAERLARGTCVRVSVVSGNLDSKQQRQQLNKGCDLLVASRGRALQLMQEGTVGLERTETLCFDEADVLLQGEGPQQIDCMLALCPPNVQVRSPNYFQNTTLNPSCAPPTCRSSCSRQLFTPSAATSPSTSCFLKTSVRAPFPINHRE
jgi:superfamily II DNA/RNA helicase